MFTFMSLKLLDVQFYLNHQAKVNQTLCIQNICFGARKVCKYKKIKVAYKYICKCVYIYY